MRQNSTLLGYKQQKVPVNTDWQFEVGLYMNVPGSCSATRIRLEDNARRSRLVLYANGYGYGSLVGLQNYVLSADVPSVCQYLVSFCRNVLPDTTNITSMTVTGTGLCIYLFLHGTRCTDNLLSKLKLILFHWLQLAFRFEGNQFCLHTCTNPSTDANQISFPFT